MRVRLIAMKAQFVVATLCFLLLGQASAGFFDWFKKQDPFIKDYDLLNSELVDHVQSDKAQPNIIEALNWLLMSKGEIPRDPDVVLPSPESLLQFTALLHLMDPEQPHCDMEAYNILNENELSTGKEVLVPPERLGPLRRIEQVIYDVAQEHADACRHVYPILLQKALAKADRKTIREIRSMMNSIIATSKSLVFFAEDRDMDPRHVAVRKSKGVSMRGFKEAVAVLLDLRERSREDADNRYLSVKPDPRKRDHWIVDEARVVQMMEQYVYSRCEYLKRELDHVMVPAEFEQQLYSRDRQYRAINDRTAELMIWLEYSRLCREIMDNKRKLENNVIKAIWSELSSRY